MKRLEKNDAISLLLNFLNDINDDCFPTDLLENSVKNTIELELAKPDVNYNTLIHKGIELDLKPKKTMTNCLLQFNAIKTTFAIIERLYDKLKQEEKNQIEKTLNKSMQFSKGFNGSVLLRFLLWKNGYLSNTQALPSLYDFQINTTNTLLTILIKNYWHCKTLESYEKCISFVITLVMDYVNKTKEIISLTKSKADTQVKYGFFGTNMINEGQNWLVKLHNMIYFQVFPKTLQLLQQTKSDQEKRCIIKSLFGELLHFSS